MSFIFETIFVNQNYHNNYIFLTSLFTKRPTHSNYTQSLKKGDKYSKSEDDEIKTKTTFVTKFVHFLCVSLFFFAFIPDKLIVKNFCFKSSFSICLTLDFQVDPEIS